MELSEAARVGVVVLNWNGKSDTLACLESLSRLHYPNRQIIVVDNGSFDGSVPAIRSSFPTATVVETGANLGYAGGNNVGIGRALADGTDFVFVLNNDATVSPDVLDQLVRVSRLHQDRVILGALTLSQERPRAVQFAGGFWSTERLRFEWVHPDDYSELGTNDILETDYVQGSAIFFSADALRKVGMLDERFFLTYEDTDWCYRARKHGYRSLISMRAIVWHRNSPSFGGKRSPLYAYFITRNRLLWTEIHVGSRAVRAVLKQLYWTFCSDFRDEQRLPDAQRVQGGRARKVMRFVRQPSHLAILAGMRDYVLRRFGDCPRWIRALKA